MIHRRFKSSASHAVFKLSCPLDSCKTNNMAFEKNEHLSKMARAVSFRGIALLTPLAFSSNLEGFERFGRWSQDLFKTYALNKVLSVWNLPVITG